LSKACKHLHNWCSFYYTNKKLTLLWKEKASYAFTIKPYSMQDNPAPNYQWCLLFNISVMW
jgi:hypothetical protein